MWIKTTLIALFACSMQAIGQTHFPDMTLETDFAAQVKSIDEFIARFNGGEAKPGTSSDSVRNAENIISLFDSKMSQQGFEDTAFKKHVYEFVRVALDWNGKLSLSGSEAIAEATCLIKYGGKQHSVTLFLKRDSTVKGNNKWGIEGVRGLEKLGLYDEKRITISPVDHETHFMSLQDFFQSNRKLVPSLRTNDKDIDQMSLFFGLCIAKAIDFIRVNELKFHFTGMPLYNFVVEEIGRDGTNSGWLITKIIKTASDMEKMQYYNELFKKQ